MSGSQTAAQAVSFRTIPPNLLVPLFYNEFDTPQTNANLQTHRVLIVAASLTAVPMLPVFMPPPGGTGAQGAAQAAAALFGFGSMAAEMVGKYRNNDKMTELWVLPVPDPSGGTQATATIVVTGPATGNGTISLYLNDYLLQIGVTSGQTATAIATAIAAAFGAASPVTAAASSGTVTLTSRHKLVRMNAMTLGLNYLGSQGGQSTPAGLTISVSAFTGGAGVPDLSGIAAALGTRDFDFPISGYGDPTSRAALTGLMSDTSGRWSYLEQLYGGVWSASVDTNGVLLTLGSTVNDQHGVIWGAYGTPTAPWNVAAACTAIAVPSIIGQPNLPLTNLAVPGVMAPPADSALPSISTIQSLLAVGISLLTWDRTGTCRIVRAVTTYQTNSFGVADQSYQDVGTLYTLMAVLRRLHALVTQRYGNVLLIADDTPIGGGIPAVSPKIVKNDLIAEYYTMERLGLVENAEAFAKALIVVQSINNPKRLDVLFPPDIIPGLFIFAVKTQFKQG